MKYQKPAIDLDEKIKTMKSRGFSISNDEALRHALLSTGYYRLSAYTLPFESGFLTDGSRNHLLKRPTVIEEILDLYEFDRKLRLHVMDAIERIEIALRSRWADLLALESTPHAYLDSTLFQDKIKYAQDLVKLHGNISKSTEIFVTYYREHYNDPPLPPIWAAVETTTLGQLSHWYKNTASTTVKREVMRFFGMPTIVAFEGVLHALTPVRNICAHHGRLWNRKFTLRLPGISSLHEQLISHSKNNTNDLLLFNYLIVINALMENANLDSSWILRLTDLLSSQPSWQLALMGFTDGWKSHYPWNKT